MFEILIPLNMLVTIVYWSMLMQTVTGACEGDSICVLHSYTVHSLPLICCVLDFSVTDIIVKARHSLVLLIIAVIYLPWNYHVTVSTGVPVYWFLDWKDNTSAMIGGGMTFGTMAFFCLMSWFTKMVRSLRRRSLKTH